MNIGINMTAIRPQISGGMEYYIMNLIEEISRIDLTNKYILFTNRENHSVVNISNNNFHKILCNVNPRF